MMQELQKGQNDLLPEVTNLIPVFIENLGNPKVSVNRLALLFGIVFFKSKNINKKTVITYPDFFIGYCQKIDSQMHRHLC